MKYGWDEIKNKIERIDPWDCHPGEVADGLKLLIEWIDRVIVCGEESK